MHDVEVTVRPCGQSYDRCYSRNLTMISADDFAHYFAAKIDHIRAITVSSPSPVIDDRSVDQPLSDLASVTALTKW